MESELTTEEARTGLDSVEREGLGPLQLYREEVGLRMAVASNDARQPPASCPSRQDRCTSTTSSMGSIFGDSYSNVPSDTDVSIPSYYHMPTPILLPSALSKVPLWLGSDASNFPGFTSLKQATISEHIVSSKLPVLSKPLDKEQPHHLDDVTANINFKLPTLYKTASERILAGSKATSCQSLRNLTEVENTFGTFSGGGENFPSKRQHSVSSSSSTLQNSRNGNDPSINSSLCSSFDGRRKDLTSSSARLVAAVTSPHSDSIDASVLRELLQEQRREFKNRLKIERIKRHHIEELLLKRDVRRLQSEERQSRKRSNFPSVSSSNSRSTCANSTPVNKHPSDLSDSSTASSSFFGGHMLSENVGISTKRDAILTADDKRKYRAARHSISSSTNNKHNNNASTFDKENFYESTALFNYVNKGKQHNTAAHSSSAGQKDVIQSQESNEVAVAGIRGVTTTVPPLDLSSSSSNGLRRARARKEAAKETTTSSVEQFSGDDVSTTSTSSSSKSSAMQTASSGEGKQRVTTTAKMPSAKKATSAEQKARTLAIRELYRPKHVTNYPHRGVTTVMRATANQKHQSRSGTLNVGKVPRVEQQYDSAFAPPAGQVQGVAVKKMESVAYFVAFPKPREKPKGSSVLPPQAAAQNCEEVQALQACLQRRKTDFISNSQQRQQQIAAARAIRHAAEQQLTKFAVDVASGHEMPNPETINDLRQVARAIHAFPLTEMTEYSKKKAMQSAEYKQKRVEVTKRAQKQLTVNTNKIRVAMYSKKPRCRVITRGKTTWI